MTLEADGATLVTNPHNEPVAIRALLLGERLDTRSIFVTPTPGACDHFGWSSFQARYADEQRFDGWWRSTCTILQTVAACPAPEVPISLTLQVPAKEP